MTATTHDIVRRPASTWTTERKKGGDYSADATNFTDITTVRGALQICSLLARAGHEVTATSIGKASSTLS